MDEVGRAAPAGRAGQVGATGRTVAMRWLRTSGGASHTAGHHMQGRTAAVFLALLGRILALWAAGALPLGVP